MLSKSVRLASRLSTKNVTKISSVNAIARAQFTTQKQTATATQKNANWGLLGVGALAGLALWNLNKEDESNVAFAADKVPYWGVAGNS
jgi:hypothetical protein